MSLYPSEFLYLCFGKAKIGTPLMEARRIGLSIWPALSLLKMKNKPYRRIILLKKHNYQNEKVSSFRRLSFGFGRL